MTVISVARGISGPAGPSPPRHAPNRRSRPGKRRGAWDEESIEDDHGW